MKTIPAIVNVSYILLLLLVVVAIVLVFRKTVKASAAKRKYLPIIGLLLLWAVITLLTQNGFFLNTIKNTPPPFMPAVLATNLFAAYFALFYKPLQEFSTKRMHWAVAIQTFRLPLELIFVWLLSLGFLPVQMTFEGLNYDVLVGLTAPLIAYFGYYKKLLPKWALIGWNFAGLALLANIVAVAMLSAPSNFQVFTNLPHNTMVFVAPYHFIPFFLVPLALFGHLFALKRLFTKKD